MNKNQNFYNGWKPTGGINYYGVNDPMDIDNPISIDNRRSIDNRISIDNRRSIDPRPQNIIFKCHTPNSQKNLDFSLK